MKLEIDSCETYYFRTDDSYYLLTKGYRTVFIYCYFDNIKIFIR